MVEHLVDERRFNAMVFLAALATYAIAFINTTTTAMVLLLIPLSMFAARIVKPAIPAWLLLIVTTATVLAVNTNLEAEGAFFLICMAGFATTATTPRSIPIYVLLLAAVCSPVPIAMSDIPADNWQWPFWSMGTFVGAFFGAVLAQQRELTVQLHDAQTKLADRAAVEERRRIAREVHDLVGHSLTVVLLHVTGARRLVRRDPDEAERALQDAERAGRGALSDIRRTVSLLREEGDGRVPTPTGQDLHALIAESRAAGMQIEVDIGAGVDGLDETTGLATYRIVQEALANAARHAPGATTHITLRVPTDHVEVSVLNGPPTMPTPPSTVGGSGIAGMTERAIALGGRLTTEQLPDEGWHVRAIIPRHNAPRALS